jgi:hypothetical protein
MGDERPLEPARRERGSASPRYSRFAFGSGSVSLSGTSARPRSPEALLAAPADDGNLAACARHSSISPIFRWPHQRCSSRPMARRVVDLAREERAALAELLQHVAAEAAFSFSQR